MLLRLAALLIVCAASAAQADGCADPTTAIRLANTRYRATVNELRSLQRDLPSAALRGDEFALRTIRRYGLSMRDVKEQRSQILALYHGLMLADCPPFDASGYEQTRDDFRFYTEEEEKILASARRQMSQASAEN